MALQRSAAARRVVHRGSARSAAVERQHLSAPHLDRRRHRRSHRHRGHQRRLARPCRRARQHLDADDVSGRRCGHHEPERHGHAAADAGRGRVGARRRLHRPHADRRERARHDGGAHAPPSGATTLRSIELFGSPSFANAGSATDTPPSIARLNSGVRANLFMGGSLTPELGALVSATGSARPIPNATARRRSPAASVPFFANVTSTPSAGDEVRVIAWGQRASDAAPHHAVFDNNTDNQHVAGAAPAGRVAASAWRCQRSARCSRAYTLAPPLHRPRGAPAVVVVDRLLDGPVPSLLDPGIGTDRTWALGGRLNRTRGAHNLLGGFDVYGRRRRACSPCSAGGSAKLLNGLPARVWDFTDPAQPSNWRETSLAAVHQRPHGAQPAGHGGRRPAVRSDRRFGRRQRHHDQLARPAPASRLPLDDVELLGARRVRQLRPLRPPSAAERSGVRRSIGADRQHLPLECDDRGRAAAERDRSARGASRARHRRCRRILVDRSRAEAPVPGRSWCSASTRGRALERFCALPPWAGARRTLSACPTSACRSRRTRRSRCRTWASTSWGPRTITLITFYNRSPRRSAPIATSSPIRPTTKRRLSAPT